ncbi:alpha/beta hydrolase family esterase [Methylocella sp.]|uniref:extracellular catalytic domain type 1 short-chain-length polyhydroxyalkanoate depolymerase n=1 Tax=Methylocella sp. TaxID=1978226 RepID=UPI003C1F441E
MKSILGGAVRRAAALTSRQNLTEATKVIQHALSGGARGDRAESARADAPRDRTPEEPKSAALWSAFAPPPAFTPPPKGTAASDASIQDPRQDARKAPPIGEVLHLLQKGFVPVRAPGFAPHVRPAPEVPTPRGAQFVSKTHAGPAGSRDYKLFVPSNAKSRADGRGLPLIVMLHGCTQNPDDFALGTGMNALAEKHGCLVAYPKQPTSSNNMACWNWFSLKDQARDSGEPAILAGMVREIMAEFSVDPDRVFVAGLSAGGAMAAILAATYPDLFAAAGIHSGLPYGAASDVGSAFNSMRKGASGEAALAVETRVRTIVFHGDADRTVHPANGELIVAAARAGLGAATEKTLQGRSAGGVPYKRTVIADKRGAEHVEYWRLEGMGHAWSGGHPDGSYTNPHGPDASREMMRFFLG